MFINNEHWKTENIVQGISRIPTQRAHFMIWMAFLAGIMFLTGLLRAGSTLKSSLGAIPDSLLLMLLGSSCFALCFPIPYVVYLAKELQKTKERVAELEAQKASSEPGIGDR